MKKSVLKYVSVILFFLTLGGGSVWECSAKVSSVCSCDEEMEDVVSLQAGDVVHTILMETFSSVWRVETLQMNSRGESQEFYRLISVYPKVAIIPSVKKVDTCNFMHLLSERHYQGFYIISLEKLII